MNDLYDFIMVGGGSSVNVMAYTRGSRRDYELWNEACVGAGWSWDDLEPYFRRQEGNQRLDNAAHGGDGPLKVSARTVACACSGMRSSTWRSSLARLLRRKAITTPSGPVGWARRTMRRPR